MSNSQIVIRLTSCDHISRAGTVEFNASDHLPIFAIKKLPRNDRNMPRERVKIRSYANYSFETVSESLSCYN